MGEVQFHPEKIEAIARLAAPLGWRLPRIRDQASARRVAHGIHTLLVNVVNGRSALDIAIGEGLAALSVGFRAMNLKYSNVYDYAREELGLNASTAAKSERLAKRLRYLPAIRDAVRRGELSVRKAEIIAQVATPENETGLLLRAMGMTVRELRAEVKAPPDPDEQQWVSLCATVDARKRPVLDTALGMAGWVLEKPTASKMERVAAWCQEYRGTHEVPPDDHADDALFTRDDEVERAKEALEEQYGKWADLARAPPIQAPQESGEIDPWRIDAELRERIEQRRSWDDVLGQLLLLLHSSRGWHELGFRSFGHYCEEVLGMAERTAAQRVALERGLERHPLLRKALQEKRVTYEKARLIARDAPPEQVPQWIEKAPTMTCIELRRALEEKHEAQMCAQDKFQFWMPEHVADLLKGTFRALRAAARRFMDAGECLLALALHFIYTYKHLLSQSKTLQRRIRERDGHRCQVPGCSRPAAHGHHIKPRSEGGPDDDWNLISLCASHHLNGIHGGRMRVTGRAPDELVWEFGLRRSHAQTAA